MDAPSEPILLFRVTDVVDIREVGCVVLPGVPAPSDLIPVARKSDEILLRFPNGGERRTFIRGFESIRQKKFYPEIPILLPREFKKADIPIGTEVWLASV